MTTLSWDRVGGDPAPGDPRAFDELAGALSVTAERAADAYSELERLSSGVDPSIWRGEAADAFRERIKDLPPKLERLHKSYEAASGVLAEYGKLLADLQPTAQRLLEDATEAEQEEVLLGQRRDEAQANQSAEPLAPASVSPPFDQAIDEARAWGDDVRRQIGDLRGVRKAAEGRVVAGLARAHDLGIKNKSWLSRKLSSIDGWVDKHADGLRSVAGVLRRASGIAGILSFIPGLNVICVPIAVITAGAALLLDAALCVTGNGTWKTLVLDAALMALPFVGGAIPLPARVGLAVAVLSGSDRREDRRIRNDRITRTPEGGRGGSHRDNDWAGRSILERYLTGGGDWTINNDPDWNKYMMDNEILASKLHPKVQDLALDLFDQYKRNGLTKAGFNDTFPMEIENGEGVVGYQYLHGTNKDAGGFKMQGERTIVPTPYGYEVRIKANYTWNDIIDPNPQYSTDRWKSRVAEVATLGQADPYSIHITWTAETVVKLDHDGNVLSMEGYPN